MPIVLDSGPIPQPCGDQDTPPEEEELWPVFLSAVVLLYFIRSLVDVELSLS
jgi:hypothetical protein